MSKDSQAVQVTLSIITEVQMKNLIYKTLLFVLISTLVSAQMPDFSKEVQSAMAQLSVMEGKWKGTGWRLNPDGSKSTSNIEENLVYKLDKTVFLVEGIGTLDNGTVVHHALGFITFNPMTKTYTMKSFLINGLSMEANFEIVESNRSFIWWFKDQRGGTIRYKVKFENNTWNEEGEYSRDGQTWFKTLEMSLAKVE